MPFDVGTESRQLVGEILVSPIDQVYPVDVAHALCRECGDEVAETATQIRDAINALPSVYGAIVTGTGTGPFTIKVPGIAVPITVNSHITGGAAVLS